MCLIIVVLAVMNNRALDQWTLPIQPNSLIAVFTTIGKTGLLLAVTECISQLKWLYFEHPHELAHLQLFDDASRGPWGATAFLWATRGRAILATLGAVITIAALAIEPFAQQILEIGTRTVSQPSNEASMEYARSWQSNAFHSTGRGECMSSNTLDGSVPGQHAHSEPSLAFLLYACLPILTQDLAESVIDFSPATLILQTGILNGMTGAVANVPFRCPTSECRWPQLTSLALCGKCSNITDSARVNCTRIPGFYAAQCVYTPSDDFFDPINMTRANAGDTYISSTLFQTTANAAPEIDRPRVGFMAASSIGEAIMKGDITDPGRVDVTTCEWYWCMQTYRNVTATNGNIHVNRTDSVPLKLTDTYSNNGSRWHGYVPESDPEGQDPDHTPGRFNITNDASSSLFVFLRESFTLRLDPQTRWGETNITAATASYVASNSLEHITLDIAETVTNLIRSYDNINASTTYGTIARSETYVVVRWGWLSLPLLMTLLANLLLVLSIIYSASRPELFKSSILAVIFHGLRGWQRDQLQIRRPETASALEDTARQMKTELRRDSNGHVAFEPA